MSQMKPRQQTEKESVNTKKLSKRLGRKTGQAIADYQMIESGDRIMVCLSGGKDSFAMLDILMQLQEKAPVEFELVAVNLDQKQPGFPEQVLPEYLTRLGIEFYVIEQDTYSIVKDIIPEGKTTCGLCSRLRRGVLYNFAQEKICNKMALGHHRDDIIETLFLNMFHGGTLKTMPPKLLSDDGRNTVIRPLAYCKEADLAAWSAYRKFPIIPCNLCGSQENLQRQNVKAMLQDWQIRYPGRVESIFRSMQYIVPSHLLDRNHFDFASLGSLKDLDSDLNHDSWLLSSK